MAKAVLPNTAWLLTGGNMGNRRENLANAFILIKKHCGEIIHASAIYETAAWGKNDQPSFLNQVLEVQTGLEPLQLLKQTLSIEKKLGRIREEKYGPRTIDIDILLFNDDVVNEPSLVIPHPRMQNRRFVLVPLAEIAGNMIHPVFHKTIAQLLEECPDKLNASVYKD